MIDFEVHRAARTCAASGRLIEPGQPLVTALVSCGAEVERRDYLAANWSQPPAGTIAWWRWLAGDLHAPRARMAPNEALLALLSRWSEDPDHADSAYVLALLLVRRRVLKIDPTAPSQTGMLRLAGSDGQQVFDIAEVLPTAERVGLINEQLQTLLHADAN